MEEGTGSGLVRLRCPGALYGNGIAQASLAMRFGLSYLKVPKILAGMVNNALDWEVPT